MSSQRDSQTAQLAQERGGRGVASSPDRDLPELPASYEAKGLSAGTTQLVARELTQHDVLAAHIEAELQIDVNDLANPLQARGVSALSFSLGALLPLVAIPLPPALWRVPVTFVVVLLARIAGAVSARIGGSEARRAVQRVVLGSAVG